MIYIIRPLVLNEAQSLEITYARFQKLSQVSERQWQYLGIEEKFDVLFTNYEEFEEDALRVALRSALHPGPDWARMSSDKLTLARRIVNVLTAARLYREQVGGDLVRLKRQSGVPSLDIEELWEAQLTKSFGFRAMEALRNHVQHSSIPFDRIAYPSRLIGEMKPPLWQFGIELSIDAGVVSMDRQFDEETASALSRMTDEQNDVIRFLREYIEGIGNVHSAVRASTEADADECARVIETAIAEWKTAAGEADPTGLGAVEQHEDMRWGKRVYLNPNASTRRLDLIRRNRLLQNLSRRFVSGERRAGNG